MQLVVQCNETAQLQGCRPVAVSSAMSSYSRCPKRSLTYASSCSASSSSRC
jgi:hypothetical protein